MISSLFSFSVKEGSTKPARSRMAPKVSTETAPVIQPL